MYIADALSRNFPQSSRDHSESDYDIYVHELGPVFPASDEKLKTVRDATQSDTDLKQVIYFIENNAWPSNGKYLNETLKNLFPNTRDTHNSR